MLDTYLGLTYTVIWSLAIANIVGAGICFFALRRHGRLTAIRFVYMAPFLLTVIFFGAFQSSRQWGDMVTLFVSWHLCRLHEAGLVSRVPPSSSASCCRTHIEILLYQVGADLHRCEDLAARPLIWVLLMLNVLSLWFGLANRPQLATEGNSATDHQAAASYGRRSSSWPA